MMQNAINLTVGGLVLCEMARWKTESIVDRLDGAVLVLGRMFICLGMALFWLALFTDAGT